MDETTPTIIEENHVSHFLCFSLFSPFIPIIFYPSKKSRDRKFRVWVKLKDAIEAVEAVIGTGAFCAIC